MTPGEYETLETLARQQRRKIGGLIRSWLKQNAQAEASTDTLRREARESEVEEIVRALLSMTGAIGRVGNNVNQLAHVANSTGNVPALRTLGELKTVLAETRSVVRSAIETLTQTR